MMTLNDELAHLRMIARLYWQVIGDLGGELIVNVGDLPPDGAPIVIDIEYDERSGEITSRRGVTEGAQQ